MLAGLYGKIKERKGEWLIGASTQNLLYLSFVATQPKARKARRRVLIIGKARRRIGAQARKARRLEGAEGAQFSRLKYE